MIKLSLSKEHNPSYIASICTIDTLEPVPDSDFLNKTIINGFDIVVNKNNVSLGDKVIYFPIECCISENILSKLNLYNKSCYEKNSNYKEYNDLLNKINEENTDEENVLLSEQLKSMTGFFEKHGRVKCINLRKLPSQGFTINVDALNSIYDNKIDFSNITDFDTIDDEIIVKKYVPVQKQNEHNNLGNKRNNKIRKKFNKVIDENFNFHYDTNKLNNNMHNFYPDTYVHITKKIHGTSFISTNILCNKKLNFIEKIKKFFGFNIQTKIYDNIYSSRNVIRNKYTYNKVYDYEQTNNDLYTIVNNMIKPYIEEGMSIYGEIYGYKPNTQTCVQAKHDYGAKEGQLLFTIYRINKNDNEYEIPEIIKWCDVMMAKAKIDNNQELLDAFRPLQILYNGTLNNLYNDIDIDLTNINENSLTDWRNNLLNKLKNDKKNFYMEMKDNECKHKVPFEGIVIRIYQDKLNRAFKLKTDAHYKMETKNLDEGIEDIESDN